MHDLRLDTPSSFATDITNETGAKLRTFLYEVAEEITHYRSLQNLTEQVEHQYHGRFLIELIQNAHDALKEKVEDGESARIEFVLALEDGNHGALYVANDGVPFSRSNFKSLSQLGQSDKNPEKSIGNKGIGFRSVLEISEAPEIYSRREPGAPTFNGYCFGFSPSIIERCLDPTLRLLRGEDAPPSPLSPSIPLVDWEGGILRKFRSCVMPKGEEWLKAELRYLSPYLLPFPICCPRENDVFRDFEERGFATVIRLPLKSSDVRQVVQENLKALEASTILFLERATSLVLDSGNDRRELTRRQSRRFNGNNGGYEVVIQDAFEPDSRRYWIWTKSITADEDSAGLFEAVGKLPGKWPEMKKVDLALAVRMGRIPERGVFSIFLPTGVPTGCAAHINAPFFGDMSRTNIDFKNPYNLLLLEAAVTKALDIVLADLAGKGVDDAGAIVDLIAPWPSERESGLKWFYSLQRICFARGQKLQVEPIVLSDKGWSSLEETSLIPRLEHPRIMTQQHLRSHACFPAFVAEMAGRHEQLEVLFNAVGIGEHPSDEHMAATVESIARESMEHGEGRWNDFWNDAIQLFSKRSEPLKGKDVLLGTDNKLHANGEECSVFFTPRKGSAEDEDFLNETAVHEIPEGLRKYIAFLHPDIQVYDERDARTRTPIHRFLDSTMVQTFRVEDILSSVLLARTPKLPIDFRTPESALCKDILTLGLRLVSNLVDRGKGAKSLHLMRSLPVPCVGGWCKLQESSFGPGWQGTQGQLTHDYLTAAGTEDSHAARNKLLLPPSNDLWEGRGAQYRELLFSADVFDGLRTVTVGPQEWRSTFQGSRDWFRLPDAHPPGLASDVWEQYRTYASQKSQPSYAGPFTYEVQTLEVIPGLQDYADFDDETRLLFMQILLRSMAYWALSWPKLDIRKVGGNLDTVRLESPLFFALRNIPWIGVEKDERIEWACPSQSWYVTAGQLSGRPRQFAHLHPLPGRMAQILDMQPHLSQLLQDLGMPKFDVETPTNDPRLLEALAASLDGDIEDANVFPGQVRDAWGAFAPGEKDPFPTRIVIRTGSRPLIAGTPGADSRVWLPNSSASFIKALEQFSLPFVLIDTFDAKRLESNFRHAFSEAIDLASELRVVPLVENEKWTGSGGIPLVDSEISWLIPMVLSIVAFTGVQAKGTNGAPFKERVERLRETKVCWGSSLEVGLFKAEVRIAQPRVPALWLEKEKVLLVSEECRDNPHRLSEALSILLQRDDLEFPIKLALREFQDCGPEHEDVLRALHQLKISEEQFWEVQAHWRGDLGHLVRIIRPLVLILAPSADIGRLSELETEEAVVSFLDSQGVGQLSGRSVLDIARQSKSGYRLGTAFHKILGDGAQLSAWNAALEELGEPPLQNPTAENEFRNQLASAFVPLRALLVAILRRNPDDGHFKEHLEAIESLPCPGHFASSYWQVEFKPALQQTVALFEQRGATDEELDALRHAENDDDLAFRLAAAGVDTKFDASIAFRENRESLLKTLQSFRKILVAWCGKHRCALPSFWQRGDEELLGEFSAELERTGFLLKWVRGYAISLCRQLPRDGGSKNSGRL